jgi:hypothetical protein
VTRALPARHCPDGVAAPESCREGAVGVRVDQLAAELLSWAVRLHGPMNVVPHAHQHERREEHLEDKEKAPSQQRLARGLGIIPGGDLLSHRVSPAVPSALEVLTSEFEMGSGVAPPVRPPESFAVQRDNGEPLLLQTLVS